MDLSSRELFLAITILGQLLLSAFILANNPHSKVNRSFSITVIGLSLWAFSNMIFGITSDIRLAYWMAILADISVVIVASSFLYFSYFYPKETASSQKILAILEILGVVLILLILVPDFSISGISYSDVQKGLIPGKGRLLFAAYIIVTFTLAFIRLIRSYIRAVGIKKAQLKIVFTSTFVTALISVTTNLLLPLLFDIYAFVFLGPVSTLILISGIVYTIVKHRLFDIRLAFRAGLIRIIEILIFTTVLAFVGTIILRKSTTIWDSELWLSVGLVSTIFVLGFPWLDRWVKAATDRFLFQREFNRRELFNHLGEILTKNIELPELRRELVSVLDQTLRSSTIDFMLLDRAPEDVVQYFKEHQELLVLDELVRYIEQKRISNEHLDRLVEHMRKEEIAVYVPLIASEGLIAIIALGDKKGGGAYTSNDLEALEALMYQAGVAVENAQLYEEVREFNEKLQKEVAEATHDLKIRNKRLSILRSLDQIIMNTLELEPMAQKIVDLVNWEMDFPGAMMVLLSEDKNGKYIHPVALSSAPIYDRALKKLPKPLRDYRLEYGKDPSNLFYKALEERKPVSTDSFKDLFVPPLDLKLAEELQEATKTSHVLVYPLSAKGKPLGAIAFSLDRPFEDLNKDDLELLEAFMDEAGIAIDSVRLYDELKQRNKELEMANERLTELDKMKDELVSVASHELRTPMTAIKSYIWMALNKQKEHLTPELTKYLERAFVSSDRMIELVNDMLSASRLEGGRITLDLQAYDIVPIVEETVEQLIPKAKERGLKLQLDKPEEELPLCVVDQNRFREILFNLIGNSIKYTDKGRIDVTLSAHTKISPDDGKDLKDKVHYVWVEVKDTGRGISKEDMARLFKKFSKLDQGSFTKTAESGGTGLGLYITKGLVELHGGKIWVHSEGEGKGSVFGFSVRVA